MVTGLLCVVFSPRQADKALSQDRWQDAGSAGSGDRAGRRGGRHGGEQRNFRFEELKKFWLESVQGEVKASTHKRRIVCLNQITPLFKGRAVRATTLTATTATTRVLTTARVPI